MADLFLTPEQLVDLTGYHLAAYQVRWLQKAGVRHYVRADGKPRVPVSAFDDAAKQRPPLQPNFAAQKRVN